MKGTADEEFDAGLRRDMAAAQDGDAAAYDRVLRALLPRLRSFVGKRVPDPAAAEDVVQNVLLSIHRARHTYRPERPFGPWWRTIARNASVDSARQYGRQLRREAVVDVVDVPDEREPPRSSALSPPMREALEALPPGQRRAVELLHVHGLSVAEAAERMGISRGALKVRAHRGYRALRKQLGDVAP